VRLAAEIFGHVLAAAKIEAPDPGSIITECASLVPRLPNRAESRSGLCCVDSVSAVSRSARVDMDA
jgi:hypothetical protein